MTHINHLDFEFEPGSVTCFPTRTPGPASEIDEECKRFMLCGPPELDEVQEFATELTEEEQVVSAEVEPDNTFRPPRIDVRVRVASSDAWESGEYQNPENPDGEPITLSKFIMGSLKSIALPYAEK